MQLGLQEAPAIEAGLVEGMVAEGACPTLLGTTCALLILWARGVQEPACFKGQLARQWSKHTGRASHR